MLKVGTDMAYTIKKLTMEDLPMIKSFFVDLFTKEPWNDDWSDENQLVCYLTERCGAFNSLTYGYFDGEEMVGLSAGRIIHWCTGTEYCIDEFGISADWQGRGVGTAFLKDIEKQIFADGMVQIYLHTERDVPAYNFYKKLGFEELTDEVAFAKYIE